MKQLVNSDETNDDDGSCQSEKDVEQPRGRRDTLAPSENYRDPHETSGVRGLSSNYSCSNVSVQLTDPIHTQDSPDKDEGEQHIQEVSFPGYHAVNSFVQLQTWLWLTSIGYWWRLASRLWSRRCFEPRASCMDGS